MRAIATIILCTSLGLSAAAQTTITNGGFETWDNAGSDTEEPQSWNSNKTGSSTATLGPQTCFRDNTVVHSGSYSVRVETKSGPLSTVVNGNVTTGVVNAPSFTKSEGYIGTTKYGDATDQRRMSFTGRPDSIVGWYQYDQGGHATEQAKIRFILHTGDYYDPETPTTYHPDLSANKVGDGTFTGPLSNVSTWTRFSIPVVYTSTVTPSYIMISMTSSKDQNTSVYGSKFWIDDLQTICASSPTALAATSVTGTTATINWTAPSGSTGSEYVISTTAGAPVGTGTVTTATSYNAGGLTPSTTYYASVRNNCGPGGLSNWVTISFTTSTVGVNDIGLNDFSVSAYPNPVKNELTIQVNGVMGNGAQVQIVDVAGRVIYTRAVSATTVTLGMNELSSGIYFVRYIDAQHTKTIRINKQ